MTKVVDMNYLCQWNNPVAPGGTCNVTAIAMCLSTFGIVGSGGVKNLPEELRAWIEDNNGGDRHLNLWLQKAAEWKGLKDDFRENWTLNELKQALANGSPVVLDTWLTHSGHFIVLKGYDSSKDQFIVNDSNGEWFTSGYHDGPYGESVPYSTRLILSSGLSAAGWLDSSQFPKDPANSKTFAAHVISKK
jgi:hypothetical protein